MAMLWDDFTVKSKYLYKMKYKEQNICESVKHSHNKRVCPYLELID